MRPTHRCILGMGVALFLLFFSSCDTGEPFSTQVIFKPMEWTDASTEQTEISEEGSAADTVADTESDTARDVAQDTIWIRTPEDLMAWNRAINNKADGAEAYRHQTVVLLADMDMSGYKWTPLDGSQTEGMVFDGNGHTISNLTFETYTGSSDTDESGCGFIGVNYHAVTFRNVTFDRVRVEAHDRSVGCIIGKNASGEGRVVFENVHVRGLDVRGCLGSCDWAEAGSVHPVTSRIGGMIGDLTSGEVLFDGCSVMGASLTGYHAIAGFVGYDGSGRLSADAFSGCTVSDTVIRFAYGSGDENGAEKACRFVAVFFCAADWSDGLDGLLGAGNAFRNVTYMDLSYGERVYHAEDLLG